MDILSLTDKMHQFVRSKGWYEPNSKRPQTMRNLAISISLEANEILELFQWNDDDIDREELGSELADVALYLFQLSSIAGIDLEQATLKKLELNNAREWD